ncbi:unnamed protein product, partial [Thlaspi arvense]
MALIMNLVLLLFSLALVRSDQSTVPLRSFKIGENITYDCIDIYKQSGLNHPLLKNHTIQVGQIGNNKTHEKKRKCPHGTVPVLRNTKEFIINAQLSAKKYFHLLTADSPGTHIAGVRSFNGPYHGVAAWFNGFNLNIEQDQASYSQIYIGSGLNNEVNFISTGLMGKDGLGCYNTACPRFVQVSQVVPIVEPHDLKPGELFYAHPSIHQISSLFVWYSHVLVAKDKNTGNWWITQLQTDADIDVPNVDIGYWPKELFNLFSNGVNMAGVRGVVQASHSGSSPPMGNGKFPGKDEADSAKGRRDSSIITNVEVFKFNYKPSKIDSIEYLVDSKNCYWLRIGVVKIFHKSELGFFFNYGGPGGNSCGV